MLKLVTLRSKTRTCNRFERRSENCKCRSHRNGARTFLSAAIPERQLSQFALARFEHCSGQECRRAGAESLSESKAGGSQNPPAARSRRLLPWTFRVGAIY